MTDFSNILSSLTNEDMDKIKSIAQNLMVQDNSSEKKSQNLLPFDKTKMDSVISLMNTLNENDERVKFIENLKPLLSEERQKRADNAIKFLQISKIAPNLKGLF